jgi:hypothetical protein
MSTLKNEKAILLAKIERQKASKKEQKYTIPSIIPSGSRQTNKTFIPNEKSLISKSKYEDNMRDFMSQVGRLVDSDFILDNDQSTYDNKIILDGYNSFIETYLIEKTSIESEYKPDRIEIKRDAINKWVQSITYTKLLYVLDGYSKLKGAEWSRKKFINDIKMYIRSEDELKSFINMYLYSSDSYEKFMIQTRNNKRDDVKQQEIKDDIANGELLDSMKDSNRMLVTKEEEELIEVMKKKLLVYVEKKTKLEEQINVYTNRLNELDRKEIKKKMKNMAVTKTKDQLIDTIIRIEQNSNKEKNHSDKFVEKLKRKKTKLYQLSYTDLVTKTINKTDTTKLVKLLLFNKFHKKNEKLKQNIFIIGIEIRNLSLGKYINTENRTDLLKYKERSYRKIIVLLIRKTELESMTYHKLAIYASDKGLKGYKYDNTSNEDIINRILVYEFPESNVNDGIPSVNENQMKSVLRTLDDHQINILASSNGVKDSEYRGKNSNIHSIISIKFPKQNQTDIKKLVTLSKWDYGKRKNVLDLMSRRELNAISLTIGLNLNNGTDDSELIQSILTYEKYVSTLITKESIRKEDIIRQLELNSDQYNVLSLYELEKLLEYSMIESTKEVGIAEKDRLYNKLDEIVDMNDEIYANAKSWNVKKLREELDKTDNYKWETYKSYYISKKCMEQHQRYEWIAGDITGVWLSGPDGTKPDLEYVNEDVSIQEDGQSWYQANNKFFSLQCNFYRKQRKQNGIVLTNRTITGKEVKLVVGLTVVGLTQNNLNSRTHVVNKEDGSIVKRTFIIQDEILFDSENKFNAQSIQLENKTIQDILYSVVTMETVDRVRSIISKSLLQIAPDKKDYGIIRASEGEEKSIDSNTPYMQILLKTLRTTSGMTNSEQTNKEFFNKVAYLLVFIRLPEARTFRNNLEMEYYLPDILANLSSADKFPEAFSDPNVSVEELEEITANITNDVYKIVFGLAKSEYSFRDPTRRHKNFEDRRNNTFRDDVYLTRPIKTSKRLDACSNKHRVNGVKDEDIVYYKDKGEIYCFSVNDLYERITLKNDKVNPDTGLEFDTKFVTKFSKLYNKRLSNDGFLTDFFQEKYGFNMDKLVEDKIKIDTIKSKQPNIATNLWKIIRQDIKELEDQLSNEDPSEDDEIDNEREPEKREKEVSDGVRKTTEIDEKEVCEYCKNHVSDDSIKSIILHNDESRIVKFCSFKCFEKKDDWKKIKAKKVKKKK